MACQFSYRRSKATLFAALIIATSSYAEAKTPAAPPATARVSISQVQLAFVGSAAVGGGTLHFKGRNYPFTINGLGVGGVGVSKLEATGEVYQLARISDLEGVYGQDETAVITTGKADRLSAYVKRLSISVKHAPAD